MTDNLVVGNLPTFQEGYRSANKAYKYVIYDAEQALRQVLAGSAASEILIPRYLNWCQKELNSLRSEIELGMYKNCQTYGLQEIENSLKNLIEAYQKQEEKHKSHSLSGTDGNQQSGADENMLIDNYTRMNIE